MKTLSFFESEHGITHLDPDEGDPYEIREIGSGYAQPLGKYRADTNVTLQCRDGISKIYCGEIEFTPVRLDSGAIALAPPPHAGNRVNWIQMTEITKGKNPKTKITE